MFNALAFNCDYKDAIGRKWKIFCRYSEYCSQVRPMKPLTGAPQARENKFHIFLSTFSDLFTTNSFTFNCLLQFLSYNLSIFLSDNTLLISFQSHFLLFWWRRKDLRRTQRLQANIGWELARKMYEQFIQMFPNIHLNVDLFQNLWMRVGKRSVIWSDKCVLLIHILIIII